jgi:hypothetical protein
MEKRINPATLYDGLLPGDIGKHHDLGVDATQRTVCPDCEGKCLVWNVPRWESCGTCAGEGWLLERVWLERTPEDDTPGTEAFVERRAYVVDELPL